MLETIREYARERLRASGDMEEIERAHAAYYLVLAEEDVGGMGALNHRVWFGRVEPEHDNLRLAARNLIASGNAEWAVRLATALMWFWEQTELFSEARETMGEVLNMPGAQTPTRARAHLLYLAGTVRFRLHEYPATVEHSRAALEIFRALNDRRGMATILTGIPFALQGLGRCSEAKDSLRSAAALWEELGDETARDYSLNNLASIAKLEGDYAEAQSILDPLLANFRARGDVRAVASALSTLGDLAAAQGDPARSTGYYKEALALFRELDDRAGVARVLADLGNLTRDCQDHDAARTYYLEALRECAAVGRRSSIARVLGAMAKCAALQGSGQHALTLAGAASAILRSVDPAGQGEEHVSIRGVFDGAKKQLDPEQHSRAWARGQSMTVEQVLQYAFAEID
jgi:tetratricopeptide (TPR) repeat protein